MGRYSFKGRPRVFLKKGRAKPFWYHHPWIFSGAIRTIKGAPDNGAVVEVYDDENRFIGRGFINLNSQIRVRLLSWDLHEEIDAQFFEEKIRKAIHLRENVLSLSERTNAYRIVHGESDGLPGLVVDKYDRILVAQFLSVGMDLRRDMILDILRKETRAETIVERYPARYRSLEGLKEIEYLFHGMRPPERMRIRENDIHFYINLEKGQKTGFYLDQRENRMRVAQQPYHKRCLDAFCYTGAFGIYLLANKKASEVVFMDSSSFALEMVEVNLKENHLPTSPSIKADLFKRLPEMEKEGEIFDMIILDPPKVAPERANIEEGLSSLKLINTMAMRMLTSYGMLVTCDCSGVISQEEFWKMLSCAARDSGRSLQIIEFMGAGADHPILPSCPENFYLKVAIGVVGKRW